MPLSGDPEKLMYVIHIETSTKMDTPFLIGLN